MSKYLLEVGVEELPYKFIPMAISQLKEGFKSFFEGNNIKYSDIKVMATPRRLAVMVSGLEASQPDVEKTVKGPISKVAFDENNNLTKAGEGFAAKNGVTKDDLYVEDNKAISLTTKNISGRGLACITNEPLPDFADKKLVLHLSDRDINIISRKVYSNKMEIQESDLYLNGIEFMGISEDDVSIILKECLKFQMNSKHNERLFETL